MEKKGGKWLAFCVCYFLERKANAIPIRARIGKTVANTTPVAVGHVDVSVFARISIPIGITIAKSNREIATLTTLLELPLLLGMYLRAIPIIAKIGTTVPKMTTSGVSHPVWFAPTISVIAIGTRIATSNKLTATPMTVLPLAIFVHGRPYVL